jgi:hypothetical protein
MAGVMLDAPDVFGETTPFVVVAGWLAPKIGT